MFDFMNERNKTNLLKNLSVNKNSNIGLPTNHPKCKAIYSPDIGWGEECNWDFLKNT